MTELLPQQDAEVVHPMAVSNIALFFANEGRTSNRRFGPHYLIGWLNKSFSDGLKSPIPFLHSWRFGTPVKATNFSPKFTTLHFKRMLKSVKI